MSAHEIKISETKGFKSIKFYLNDSHAPTMEWKESRPSAAEKLSITLNGLSRIERWRRSEENLSELNISYEYIPEGRLIFTGNLSHVMEMVSNNTILDEDSIRIIENDNEAKRMIKLSETIDEASKKFFLDKKTNLSEVSEIISKLGEKIKSLSEQDKNRALKQIELEIPSIKIEFDSQKKLTKSTPFHLKK